MFSRRKKEGKHSFLIKTNEVKWWCRERFTVIRIVTTKASNDNEAINQAESSRPCD